MDSGLAGTASEFVVGMKAGTSWLVVLALVTVLRLGLVGVEDPSPAEAYYYLCGQQPAPAYFDGPAGTASLVGWAVAAGLDGGLWRFQAPLWALAATVACFFLVRSLGEARVAAATALALNTLPVFNMAALRVGPALPALTLVLCALGFCWRAYEAPKRHLLWWLAAGVAIGLASNLMYAAAALLPALVVFTLCSPRHRTGEVGFSLLVFVAVAGLMLVPALAWNASLAWIPLAGGTLRTFWQFEVFGFFRSLIQLLAGFSPLVFLFMLVGWFALAGDSRVHKRARFLFLATLPGVLLTAYFSLRGYETELFLLLAAPLLVFQMLTRFASRGLRLATFGLAVLFSAYGMFNVYQTGRGWGKTAEVVRQLFLEKSATGQDGVFLVAGDSSLASVLGYHLSDTLIPPAGHPAVYVGESQNLSDQFGIWPGYDDFVETLQPKDEFFTEQKGENPFVGRSAFYISHESPNDVPQTIRAAFEVVTFLQELPPAGGGSEPLYIYWCLNYQTLPL